MSALPPVADVRLHSPGKAAVDYGEFVVFYVEYSTVIEGEMMDVPEPDAS